MQRLSGVNANKNEKHLLNIVQVTNHNQVTNGGVVEAQLLHLAGYYGTNRFTGGSMFYASGSFDIKYYYG